MPPIPGIHGEHVILVNDYWKQEHRVSNDVVVLGGGLAGCEIAVHLARQGKHVHLIEMRDTLAPDANVRHRPLLLKEIAAHVTAHTGCRGKEIRADGVLCADSDGAEVLVPGTTVICALGQRSRAQEAESLLNAAPFVRVIGDARRVSNITNAVYEAYHAARDIGG